MTIQTEALKLALEMVQNKMYAHAEMYLKEALAQPEQEPVAWMYPDALCDRSCLYVCTKAFTQFPECATIPPQRTWVGLESEDRLCAKYMQDAPDGIEAVIDYIEAKLKEKNT